LKNFEIRIEKTAFGGDGVGSVDGKTCFVEGALAGETVIARILQDKRNFIRARTVKILEPSPFRVAPLCPYLEACGGCQYQHVSYHEELRIKESQVREVMDRALGLGGAVEPIRYADKDYRYRNSVTLHRSARGGAPQPLGFIGRDNKTVVAVKNCLLADERLSPAFGTKFRLKKGTGRVTFRLSEKGEIISGETELFSRIRVGRETLLAHSRGFFQNNLAVTALLVEQVRAWVGEIRPDIFFDLYAGVGTFSLLAAKDVPRAVCVEDAIESLEALRMNAAERGRTAFRIIPGRAETVLPSVFPDESVRSAVVCLDPPRHGIEPKLAEHLSRTPAAAVLYVSCDPVTLARDLKLILKEGHYRAEKIVPFDMFPRTRHIETAVLLKAV
jgi:tRNA/tmRNA/rRNA uracil-C5-methylase (TrmA/RlmC/RlmD family)